LPRGVKTKMLKKKSPWIKGCMYCPGKFFSMSQSPRWVKASSISWLHHHTQTHHIRYDSSGWVISPSQRPLSENTQHSQETDFHAPVWIQNHNPSKWTAADSRLRPVFLNRRTAARYRAPASIIPGRERPEETTVFYKISLVQLITNLNVILYLSTCHTVYISVLILFMIMP